MSHDTFGALQSFTLASGKTARYYALSALQARVNPQLARLPVSIRIVLESLLRNCDGHKITADHVRELAGKGGRKDPAGAEDEVGGGHRVPVGPAGVRAEVERVGEPVR